MLLTALCPHHWPSSATTLCDCVSVAGVSKYSGGTIHYFPGFHNISNPAETEHFESTLHRYLTRKIGFEAVMRIRCTKGKQCPLILNSLYHLYCTCKSIDRFLVLVIPIWTNLSLIYVVWPTIFIMHPHVWLCRAHTVLVHHFCSIVCDTLVLCKKLLNISLKFFDRLISISFWFSPNLNTWYFYVGSTHKCRLDVEIWAFIEFFIIFD